MKNNKQKILIISRYFLPGFKAGGPIKSLDSFIKKINTKENKILILSSDRDHKSGAYKNIHFNKIIKKKNYEIVYLTKKKQTLLSFYQFIKKFDPSLIVLNSFFDFNFSIQVHFLNILFFKIKTFIFSRGELLKEALNIKKFKKLFYIWINIIFNTYHKVKFITSSQKEKKNIKLFFKKSTTVFYPIILNKIKKINLNRLNYDRNIFKILYVSRILPNKNLIFCLKILKKINFKYQFIIVGPIEDESYWQQCVTYAQSNKIKIKYFGFLKKNRIDNLMRSSNCFLFPSKFESFGHVIFESLSNALPVITSTNTPWKKYKSHKGISSLDLKNENLFIKQLKFLNTCNIKKYKNIRNESYSLARKVFRESLKTKYIQ